MSVISSSILLLLFTILFPLILFQSGFIYGRHDCHKMIEFKKKLLIYQKRKNKLNNINNIKFQ